MPTVVLEVLDAAAPGNAIKNHHVRTGEALVPWRDCRHEPDSATGFLPGSCPFMVRDAPVGGTLRCHPYFVALKRRASCVQHAAWRDGCVCAPCERQTVLSRAHIYLVHVQYIYMYSMRCVVPIP